VLLGWLGVAATLLAFGGRLWWVLELLVHFRPWYVVLLLPSAACALWLGRRVSAGAVLACALLNLMMVAPAWRGLLERDTAAAQLRVVVFNLSLRNSNVEDVTRFLAQTRADAAVLLEVGPLWREALDSLRPVYPYQLVHVRDDPFGIALLSAHPCAPCDEIEEPGLPPALLGRLALGRDHLWIAGVHAVPPFNGEWTRERDRYLGGISRRLAVLAGPRVLAGDFNTTPWAPGYRELLATGLHDGDRALASWPAFLLFPVVPIDHVLVSKELRVVSKRRGLPLGSDHYPIVVELEIKRN
jgi:endonuclease/exonuclease/phosphatase (EEP) superfamily protein YafD